MRKEFSIYLDLVRFTAALLVLLFHSSSPTIIATPPPFSHHGHAAVIVFFVLSGYVISYITAERENTPVAYWSSRLSRFYSLVIPIVFLTPVLDVIGESLAPQFYVNKTTHDFALVRILASLTYLNEIWTVSIMSFSNVPFWSLCYEMWYYVMFAVATFTAGRKRIFLLAAVALFVGPKILLLAPLWVLGVVLHRWKALDRLSEPTCWLLFLSSIVLYWLFHHNQMTTYGDNLLAQWIGAERARELAFSRHFLGDYPLAVIVCANFVGFRGIAHRFRGILLAGERPIRWLSGMTFSVYIMHQPILQFYAAVINGDPNTPLFYCLVMGSTLVTIALISNVTEKKRHILKRWIRKQLEKLSKRRWWGQAIADETKELSITGRN